MNMEYDLNFHNIRSNSGQSIYSSQTVILTEKKIITYFLQIPRNCDTRNVRSDIATCNSKRTGSKMQLNFSFPFFFKSAFFELILFFSHFATACSSNAFATCYLRILSIYCFQFFLLFSYPDLPRSFQCIKSETRVEDYLTL